MPQVSVVIPTFNRAGLLPRAMNSVFRQTFSDWELVVVDDGSTDNTESVVRNHASTTVRYVRHLECRGEAAARNTGIALANGSFVAFLDSDDEWLPENLATLICGRGTTVESESLEVLHGVSVTDDGFKKLISPSRGLRPGEGVADYLIARGGDITMNSVLIPRSLAVRVGFDESLKQFADWDFWIRCQNDGATFRFVPVPVSIYHRDDRSDRLSVSLDTAPSQTFLDRWRDRLNPATTRAFKARMIAPRLAESGQRLAATGLILAASTPDSLGPARAAKLLASSLLPPGLVRPLKRFMGVLASRGSSSVTELD